MNQRLSDIVPGMEMARCQCVRGIEIRKGMWPFAAAKWVGSFFFLLCPHYILPPRVNSQRKLVPSGKPVDMLKGYQFYLLETSSVHLPLSTCTMTSLAVDSDSKYSVASAAQGTDLSEWKLVINNQNNHTGHFLLFGI